MKKQLLLKKGLLTFALLLVFFVANAQTLVWKNSVVGTSNSPNGRAPQSSHRYTRTIYLIAASELSTGGIAPGRVLKAIGFNYREAEAVATATASGTLKIYLENTTATSYNKGTSWATAISTMTKVSDAAAIIPAATTADFIFTNGNTFTYTGGALYVAFEWLNLEGTLGTSNQAYCNSSTTNTGGVNGLQAGYSSSSTTVSDAITTSNNFRPATRFAYELLTNDAQVSNIYALTTAPVNEGKQTIIARITNEGVNSISNLNVTLTISGANTFTSTRTISLPAETPIETGGGYNVTFDEFIPVNQGTNTVTVSIAETDDNNANNTATRIQEVIPGIFSYNIGTAATANSGSSSQNYRYAVKYTANGTVYPKAVRFLLATDATAVGKELKAFWLNANKELMGESAIYTAVATDQGTLVTIPFTANNIAVPDVSGNTEFYVGVQQTSATGGASVYFMGTQTALENPLRPETYYSGSSSLGASSSRPSIEAVTTSATLPVTVSSFTTKLNNNKVALKWEVGTEVNVSHYEVERSVNGADFMKVAEVDASGHATYNVIDSNPLVGINYYRLKTIDNDGAYSYYGEIKSVKISSLVENTFAVYPNPIIGNEVNVVLAGYPIGQYSYKIVNTLGNILQAGNINNEKSSKHTINLNGSVSKGIYMLYLTNGKEIIQSKFIKN